MDIKAPPCAVVLVAGCGTRLGSRTASMPKCLIDVNGLPILINALRHLAAAGVAETVLVVGYLADLVQQRVGSRVGDMRVRYRINTAYLHTSTAQSLWIGLQNIDEDVLILEGDVYFEARVLHDFVTAPYLDTTLVAAWHPQCDGSVVEIDADRIVRRWVHTKHRPTGFKLEGTYKTVNLHRLSRRFVRQRLWPALTCEVARGGGEPLETVLANVVSAGGVVRAVEVTGRWVEVDDESDLQAAEVTFASQGDGPR